MNENLNGAPVHNVYVSVAYNVGVRTSYNIRDEARGLENEHERERERESVSVSHSVVYAAPQQTGVPVTRGVSPFNPEIEVSRAYNASATMSSVTYCTTTTTTAVPFATRSLDDYLRI